MSRLASDLSPSLGRVLADPGQLHQVLMNLAVNARDAMPDGGKLLIETANVDLDAGYAAARAGVKPGPYVRLMVSDTGVGMTPEVMSHLFEPFFTTKRAGEGTGLGLATVYGIVKQCGGSIHVLSRPIGAQRSSSISKRTMGPKRKSTEHARSAPRGTETILVVEDQDQVRKIAGRVLRTHGYQVLEAANAQEALLASASGTSYDPFAAERHRHAWMNGFDLADRVVSLAAVHRSPLHVGLQRPRQLDRGPGPPPAYLAKPFSPEALAAKVSAVLGAVRSAGTVMIVDDEPEARTFLRRFWRERATGLWRLRMPLRRLGARKSRRGFVDCGLGDA